MAQDLYDNNYYRVLEEVAKEMESDSVSIVAKQMKETEFLKQKSNQYHKLISAMKVSYTTYNA